MDFQDALSIGRGPLVVIRCGGKGGRCGAIQGSVIPNGPDEELLVLPTKRPCRCFVSARSFDHRALGEAIAQAREEWKEAWRFDLDWYPNVFIARPRAGVRHSTMPEVVEELERSGKVTADREELGENVTGPLICPTTDE